MRQYELMYILKPTLSDDERTSLIERLHSILTSNGAEITNVDEWGLRDIAYEIKDFKKGYYVVVTFNSDNEAINEFNRLVRINRDVLRHMIVRLEN